MTTLKEQNRDRNSKAGAGAAGVGGGTLLVLLANNLPIDNVFKSWLVILAPSVAIVISALWIRFRAELDKSFDEKEFKDALTIAKITLQEGINNPDTTDSHRAKLVKEYEQLEYLIVHARIVKVRELIQTKTKTTNSQ